MAQTTDSTDLVSQFDRFEENLDDWRDQLVQLSTHLSPSDLAKLARRWDTMRQNLDAIFLHYGRPPSTFSSIMEGLPPLMDLTQDEMDLALEALLTAKKALNSFASESQQRLPLLEQALNTVEKPDRLRRCIDKMRAIDEAFQPRIQALKSYVDQFEFAADENETLLQTTLSIIEQTKRVDAMRNANEYFEGQKREMQRWLEQSRERLERLPSAPPPSPGALSKLGHDVRPEPSDTDKALESLFVSRDKLRDARVYLESLLTAKEMQR